MVSQFKIGRLGFVLLLEISPVIRLVNDLTRKGGFHRAHTILRGSWLSLGRLALERWWFRSDLLLRLALVGILQAVQGNLFPARFTLNAILQCLHSLLGFFHDLLRSWDFDDWVLC